MINLISNIYYFVFTVRRRQHNLDLPLKRVMIELFLFHQYSCYLDFHHFPRLRFRRIYAYRALQHLQFLHTPAIPIYFYKKLKIKVFTHRGRVHPVTKFLNLAFFLFSILAKMPVEMVSVSGSLSFS